MILSSCLHPRSDNYATLLEPRLPLTAEELANLTRLGDPDLPEATRLARLNEWKGVAGLFFLF